MELQAEAILIAREWAKTFHKQGQFVKDIFDAIRENWACVQEHEILKTGLHVNKRLMLSYACYQVSSEI